MITFSYNWLPFRSLLCSRMRHEIPVWSNYTGRFVCLWRRLPYTSEIFFSVFFMLCMLYNIYFIDQANLVKIAGYLPFRHFGHFCWPLQPGSCLMNYAYASWMTLYSTTFCNFHRNCSFRCFRHFRWGLWTLVCTLPLYSAICVFFFFSFCENCCHHFPWSLWTLSISMTLNSTVFFCNFVSFVDNLRLFITFGKFVIACNTEHIS